MEVKNRWRQKENMNGTTRTVGGGSREQMKTKREHEWNYRTVENGNREQVKTKEEEHG